MMMMMTFPSMEPYVIRPMEFKAWVRHRYLVPIESAGLVCDCAAKPTLDRYGLHLSSGCNKGSCRSNIHDALVLELQNLLKYSGYWTKHEQRGLFKDADVNNNHRPDITINNPANLGYGEHTTKVIIDVAFTCVLDGVADGQLRSPQTRTAALATGTKANKYYTRKINKYQELLNKMSPGFNPENLHVVPFIVQSTGFLHGKALDLLDKIAASASCIKKIPHGNLMTYFKRRLACCLAKNLAASINSRSFSVISHSNILRDRSFGDVAIMEQQGWVREE